MFVYRVRVNVNGRVHWTAPCGFFGDANRWAMKYVRANPRPSRASVITDKGCIVADYVGEGDGGHRCIDEHIGTYLLTEQMWTENHIGELVHIGERVCDA